MLKFRGLSGAEFLQISSRGLQQDSHSNEYFLAKNRRRYSRKRASQRFRLHLSELLQMLCKYFANFWRARSRLLSKRNFARKYAFDSIFQALQDLHTFAQMQSQKFSKKSV